MVGIAAVSISYFTSVDCKSSHTHHGLAQKVEAFADAESSLTPYLRCSSLRGDGVYLSIFYGIILFNEAGSSNNIAPQVGHADETQVMMIMTVVLGYCKYLHSRKTPLWQIFYRQGTFYFVTLAGKQRCRSNCDVPFKL